MNTSQFCSACGRGTPADANFCSGCGVTIAALPGAVRPRLMRPRHPRMVAGVCSGLAIHFGWDLSLVRVLVAVATLLTSGFGVIVYVIAWVVIPDTQYALSAGTQTQGTAVSAAGAGGRRL